MTKVYDALREAEAVRHQSAESPVSTGALFATQAQASAPRPAGSGEELARLRSIVLGGVVDEFTQAVERLEQRVDAEGASLRDELEKFEQRIEERLAEADSRTCQGQMELREQLSVQSKQLGDMIKERTAETVRLANVGMQELRQSKLAGADFAAFVKALSSHLVDQSKQ